MLQSGSKMKIHNKTNIIKEYYKEIRKKPAKVRESINQVDSKGFSDGGV
jgi:hypothetical protein